MNKSLINMITEGYIQTRIKKEIKKIEIESNFSI